MPGRYPQYPIGPKYAPSEADTTVFKYSAHNFALAGEDDSTAPPAQDPELFSSLTNVMPVLDGTLRRRWGYTKWVSTSSGQKNKALYDYQSDTTGARQIIGVDANGLIQAYNDDGSSFNSSIYNFTGSDLTGREMTSRSYAYFANGESGNYRKWDGSAAHTSTKWGIDVNDATAGSGGSSGPLSPATVSDLGAGGGTSSQGDLYVAPADEASSAHRVNITGGTTVDNYNNAWSVTAASTPDDSAVATDSVYHIDGTDPDTGAPLGETYGTNYLNFTNFGFSVPGTATVIGVVVTVRRSATVNVSFPGTGDAVDENVLLIKAGARSGSDYASPDLWPGSYADKVYGGPADMWGNTLTPANVNAATFGVSLRAYITNYLANTETKVDVSIDAVGITVYYTLPSTGTWTNPNNVKVADTTYATSAVAAAASSSLRISNFGFALAGTVLVTGIKVEVKGLVAAGSTTPVYAVALDKAGALYVGPTTAAIPSSISYVTFGGSGDLWGGTWLYSDINAATFGVELYVQSASGTATVSVDHVRITVYYSQPAFTTADGGAGAVTLVTGRVYTVVFENSSTGHYSDIWPFTASTGAVAARQRTISGIPVPNDTQVTHVNILATADGGDETRLYLLAQITAGTTTYTDNTPEATLLGNAVLMTTDANGDESGVTDNLPPPVGYILPTKHRGRVYMLKGPSLTWSKSIDEVTTDTGYIAGRWEEAFPTENSVDISEGAETCRGMLTDGINLYIGTEFKIRRLTGDAPGILPPDVVHNQVGVLNQDVWKIVYKEGAPVGAIWVTPDGRIVLSDFNTFTDVGTPVSGIMETMNPVYAVSKARATFYSNASLDLYILAIPTGASSTNDQLLVFNLRTGTWVNWVLADDLSSMVFHIEVTGESQLMFGSDSAAHIYQLTPESTQDRIGVSATSIPVTIKTNWMNFEDPTLRKSLNELEIVTDDASVVVRAEGASSQADFTTPNKVWDPVNSAYPTVKTSPRGEQKVYFASSVSGDRYYRFTFTSSGSASQVLQGYSVELVPLNRQ